MRFIRSSFSPGLQALKRVVQSAFRLLGYELHRIQTDADRYRYYMAQPWVGILKPCDGIDFTPHCQLQFIREILPIYYAEYANLPRNESDNPEGFYLNNGYFGPIDAEVLYTVVSGTTLAPQLDYRGGQWLLNPSDTSCFGCRKNFVSACLYRPGAESKHRRYR
jgi:hypothetical protein